jgi:phage gpG-like protein
VHGVHALPQRLRVALQSLQQRRHIAQRFARRFRQTLEEFFGLPPAPDYL